MGVRASHPLTSQGQTTWRGENSQFLLLANGDIFSGQCLRVRVFYDACACVVCQSVILVKEKGCSMCICDGRIASNLLSKRAYCFTMQCIKGERIQRFRIKLRITDQISCSCTAFAASFSSVSSPWCVKRQHESLGETKKLVLVRFCRATFKSNLTQPHVFVFDCPSFYSTQALHPDISKDTDPAEWWSYLHNQGWSWCLFGEANRHPRWCRWCVFLRQQHKKRLLSTKQPLGILKALAVDKSAHLDHKCQCPQRWYYVPEDWPSTDTKKPPKICGSQPTISWA